MSWHIEVTGTKEDVKAMIEAREDVPKSVRAEIATRVDALAIDPAGIWPKCSALSVYVKTSGHFDSATGGNSTLEIRRVASKPYVEPTVAPVAPSAG